MHPNCGFRGIPRQGEERMEPDIHMFGKIGAPGQRKAAPARRGAGRAVQGPGWVDQGRARHMARGAMNWIGSRRVATGRPQKVELAGGLG